MAKSFDFLCDRFTGLNLSSDREHSLRSGESPYMVNFSITDSYKLKKRSGYRVLFLHDGEGRGIICTRLKGKECVVFVAGNKVYSLENGVETLLGELESDSGSVSFIQVSDKLYILDGVKIKVWDRERFSDIVPYRPLIAVSTTPDGAGVAFEEKNILTGKMRQSFSPGANSVTLQLAATELDSVDYVHVGGRTLSKDNYIIDLKKGTVVVNSTAEEMQIPDGVEIGFTKCDGNENSLHRMRRALLFGGENDTRIFLYGDTESPNVIRWSGVRDGLCDMDYFPVNNFNTVGMKSPIRSVIRHYDRLMIFCEREAFYSYMEKSENESGLEYSVFPTFPLSDSVGCEADGFAVLCNNYPITLDRHTLYRWHSSSVRDERYAEDIGERIKRGFDGWDVKNVKSFDSERTGELFLSYKDECYVYNYVLDVFYFFKGIDSRAFAVRDDGAILFVRADGALCILFEGEYDDTSPISAVWTTPYLDYAEGVKNLHRLEVCLCPDMDTRLDVCWTSNHGESGQKSFFKRYKRATFKKLDFTSLGFETGLSVQRFSQRLRHKRFEKMKLRFENSYPESSVQILSYRTLGKVTDKK